MFRRESAEHPFANLKCLVFGNGRFLLRGSTASGSETALWVLAYDFRGAPNLIGSLPIMQR